MSAIDRVKKLLAAATGTSWYAGELANGELVVFARRKKDDRLADSILETITPGGTSDDVRLAALAHVFAEELVKSHTALGKIRSGEIPEAVKREGLFACLTYKETIAALALRMDDLGKAMEG